MFTHVSLHLLNYRMLWCVKTHYDCTLNCVCSCLNEARMIDTENKERYYTSTSFSTLNTFNQQNLQTVIEVYRLSYMSSFRLKDNRTMFYHYFLTYFESVCCILLHVDRSLYETLLSEPSLLVSVFFFTSMLKFYKIYFHRVIFY